MVKMGQEERGKKGKDYLGSCSVEKRWEKLGKKGNVRCYWLRGEGGVCGGGGGGGGGGGAV